jgi:hypothetical protein
MTLARYYARKEVEASILRNMGYRALRDMVSAELTRLVNAHLDNHPKVIERAAEIVNRNRALRRMAERHELKRASA